AHALDASAAAHLGDLGPAATAVTAALSTARQERAEAVALETRHLEDERKRLTAILSEVPIATVLINGNDQIVLYDGQAAEILSQISAPRLNAPMSDYVDRRAFDRAKAQMRSTGKSVEAGMATADRALTLTLTMTPLEADCTLIFIDAAEARIAPEAQRPLTYDFALLDRSSETGLEEAPLSRLDFCVFDLETTGLLPHKDAVVQIGALRVLRGRVVETESFDTLVDPERPIPPVSTKVHGVTDAMVAGAPKIAEAGRALHRFARDGVIVAHNAPFDLAFLRRHRRAMGVDWDMPVVDTVLVSAVLFGTTEPHDLDSLAARLGVELAEADRHTALGDARATAQVLCRMLPMLEARGIDRFGRLVTEMRKHGRLIADQN
ncbi:3'-5' exonuclease, partial [Litorisediminicola beolgyonensis]